MAGVLAEELGKPVEHVDLPVEAWGEVLAGVDGMTDSLPESRRPTVTQESAAAQRYLKKKRNARDVSVRMALPRSAHPSRGVHP